MEKSEKNIACYELQQSQSDDVRLRHFSNEKNPDFSGFGETFQSPMVAVKRMLRVDHYII
jgi:hypothetical protein